MDSTPSSPVPAPTPAPPQLCAWPKREVPGLSGPEDIHIAKYPLAPWRDVLHADYPTDAHVVCYSIDGETELPRLNIGSHQYLIGEGKEPKVHWLFLDVDNPGHVQWTGPVEMQAKVDDLTLNPLLEDAGIYTTRAGYRLVWRLKEPVLARHWKSYYRQFRKYLIDNGVPADPAETLAVWSTPFRLPFVTRDGKMTQSIVDLTPIEDGYTLDWTPPSRLRVAVGGSAPAIDRTQRAVVPPTAEEWRHLIGARTAGQYYHKLQQGQPIGKPGNRDNLLMEVIASIGGYLKATDPNQIYRYIYQSVLADDSEGAPTLESAWGKCCRIASCEKGKAQEVQAQAQSRQRQPAILVHQDKHFYVLDTRSEPWRYLHYPVGGNMLVNALETYTLSGIPTIGTRSQTGGPTAVRRLVSDHGSVVSDVIYVMGQERAEFDPIDGGTLYLGCCVPKVVEEVFDDHIAEWLAALAEDKLDILLDWLATLTHISLPTCAVYLKGPPSTGKSMLISALASVWGTKATPLQEMMSAFNAGLLNCPVVSADEGVTLAQGSMSPDIVFRNLVANSDHSINRKNMPVVRVQGCARVIIAANNDKALQFDNSLTEEDLQAIVSRTLYIEAQVGAAKYLRALGGRRATLDWVTDGNRPGRIAKHIAWLTANRTVRFGNRLLVEGKLEDWHRRFIVSVGINSQVLYIIAKALSREGNQKSSCFKEDKRVFVTTEMAIEKWDIYFPSFKSPTPRRLANALSNLSVGKPRRRGRHSYWTIPWASVVAEAANLGMPLEEPEQKNPAKNTNTNA